MTVCTKGKDTLGIHFYDRSRSLFRLPEGFLGQVCMFHTRDLSPQKERTPNRESDWMKVVTSYLGNWSDWLILSVSVISEIWFVSVGIGRTPKLRQVTFVKAEKSPEKKKKEFVILPAFSFWIIFNCVYLRGSCYPTRWQTAARCWRVLLAPESCPFRHRSQSRSRCITRFGLEVRPHALLRLWRTH